MKISRHFKLSELTRSNKAEELEIDNFPNDEVIDNLTRLAWVILEPCRNGFGSFTPSSGYRCLELNRVLRSRDSSQHILGEAVDFEIQGVDNKDLFEFIVNNLDYDKVILEKYREGNKNSGWIHCSYRETNNRKQAYVYDGRKYTRIN